MTQIISVITQQYALLASDRRLTFAEGPKKGQVTDDDTCKLVNFCNICGIGYTGLARIESIPTHEWIAKTLASANCDDPGLVGPILTQHAERALSSVSRSLRRQTFLMAGWAKFTGLPGLRSHFCVVTNAHDESGQVLTTVRKSFHYWARALRDDEDFLWDSIGQNLSEVRAQGLERNLRRLVARDIGPKEALRLLMDEIINTSAQEKSVGTKVLGFCIPKRSVEKQIETGHSMMIAQLPNENSAAFTYFEPGYSELRQFGPTVICGEFAATDIRTENDPSRDYQSSEMRLLSLPKAEDLKKRGDYGVYTVYRIKPEYKEKYYTCKQLKKATRHFNWGDR
jgi:hypothetical protein